MSELLYFLETHVMNKLSERERRLVMFRQLDVFGLGVNSKTYREIGALENVTLERATQITLKAKRRIAYRLHLIGESQKIPHVIIKEVVKEDESQTVPNLPMNLKYIYDLGEISVRNWNCLRNTDLLLVDKLLEQTERDLLKLPNYGRKSLNELKELLATHGLKLKESRP